MKSVLSLKSSIRSRSTLIQNRRSLRESSVFLALFYISCVLFALLPVFSAQISSQKWDCSRSFHLLLRSSAIFCGRREPRHPRPSVSSAVRSTPISVLSVSSCSHQVAVPFSRLPNLATSSRMRDHQVTMSSALSAQPSTPHFSPQTRKAPQTH